MFNKLYKDQLVSSSAPLYVMARAVKILIGDIKVLLLLSNISSNKFMPNSLALPTIAVSKDSIVSLVGSGKLCWSLLDN